LLGCKDWKEPYAEQPAWLRISNARLVLAAGDTIDFPGKDVWLYQQSRYLGTFELPAQIPVLNTQPTNRYLMGGGVAENGITTSRVEYPFWQLDTLIQTLVAGNTYSFQPVWRYYPDSILKYAFLEDFDQAQSQFIYYNSTKDTVFLEKNTQDFFRGRSCGIARFTADTGEFSIASANSFALPRNAGQFWLEIAYKCSIPFSAGLITVADNLEVAEDYIFIRPSPDKWRIIYINLTPLVFRKQSYAQFRTYFRARSIETGFIQLDNLKLLHFNI
jgi:hypothetical protein